MATGIYGTVRPADVSPQDVEIFYTFQDSVNTKATTVNTLNPIEVLEKYDHPNNVGRIIGGLYNLKLPTNIFNTKGIYTLMIRPKEIQTTILDCGILSAKPDIRGIIFDLSEIDTEDLAKFENNGLIGYRIEFLTFDPNSEEKKIQNYPLIITSNFRVSPVSENLNNTTQKGLRYIINDAANLVFCTVTPSSAPSINPNAVPFIGQPNQSVILTNTYFDPISIRITLVEHDFDTLAIGIYGNQTKSIEDGIRTYYNENDEIYKQFDEYVIQDDVSNDALFEVKRERDVIDFTKDFNQISE